MDNEQETAAAVANRVGEIVLPGLEVCRVARDGSRCDRFGNPIWTLGRYVARIRKYDGALIWNRSGSFYGTRSGRKPSAKFQAECRKFAAENGIPYINTADHNQVIKAN